MNVMRDIFTPSSRRDRHFSVIQPQQVHVIAGWEVPEIKGYASPRQHRLSWRALDDAMLCSVMAYKANAAPFQVGLGPAGRSIELQSVNVAKAAQDALNLVPRFTRFTVHAADLDDKPGMVFVQFGKPGLAGAPVIDMGDSGVVGLCVLGLPADVPVKTQIGAIDLRAVLG